MREPTLEGFGRKLAIKFGVMMVGALIVSAYSSRGLPTEGLETHIPARPQAAAQVETRSDQPRLPGLPDR